jgi:hypothetical protein
MKHSAWIPHVSSLSLTLAGAVDTTPRAIVGVVELSITKTPNTKQSFTAAAFEEKRNEDELGERSLPFPRTEKRFLRLPPRVVVGLARRPHPCRRGPPRSPPPTPRKNSHHFNHIVSNAEKLATGKLTLSSSSSQTNCENTLQSQG